MVPIAPISRVLMTTTTRRGSFPVVSTVRRIHTAAAAKEWATEDKRRLLHASYRVNDLASAISGYEKHFGMTLLRKTSEGNATTAFLGFGPESTNFTVAVVADARPVDLGTAFGHFGLFTDDVYAMCDRIKADGGKVTREAGPVKGGTTVIAFAEDSTQYKWELIQRTGVREPLCQVMLRVADLDKSMAFYSQVLGMQKLRQRDNQEYKYTLGFMGYGPEDQNTVIELTYNYGKDTSDCYSKGDGYLAVAVATDDVNKTADAIRAAGYLVTHPPGPLEVVPGMRVKATACEDPDGYKIIFVENS